jgi:hypothetical protein
MRRPCQLHTEPGVAPRSQAWHVHRLSMKPALLPARRTSSLPFLAIRSLPL